MYEEQVKDGMLLRRHVPNGEWYKIRSEDVIDKIKYLDEFQKQAVLDHLQTQMEDI